MKRSYSFYVRVVPCGCSDITCRSYQVETDEGYAESFVMNAAAVLGLSARSGWYTATIAPKTGKFQLQRSSPRSIVVNTQTGERAVLCTSGIRRAIADAPTALIGLRFNVRRGR